MTIYYHEPVKGNFDDATNAILKTIHSDDEDELDDSTIDNKYYVTGMGNSNLTNETMRVESIKRH